tara:strand:- start:781 stop:1404 length:624 start_codon:yes stop_codon:yes gene_type:complete
MFDAIIFDLDYTLYDESSYLEKSIDSLNIIKKKIVVEYKFRINSKNIIKDILKKYNCYNEKNSSIIFNNLKKNKVQLKIYKGFIPLFKKLKKSNIKIGILTNGNSIIQKNKIKNLKLKKYFDLIIIAKEAGKEKPHKEAFSLILKKMGSDPKKSLFVGDNSKNDIVGAKSIGMKTLWINHLKINYNKANFMVNSPLETPKKILQLIK